MTRREFNEWLEGHYDELYAVARRLTRTEDQAQDALHNAVSYALAGEALAALPAHRAWPFMTDHVRGAASNARRGAARADSASGRAGSVIDEQPLRPDSERAWFMGPHSWRQAGGTKAPRLRAPRPDEPLGEYTVQPGPRCRRCAAPTLIRLQAGRDYHRDNGRLPQRQLTSRCLNGHAQPVPDLQPQPFGASWSRSEIPLEAFAEDARRTRKAECLIGGAA